MKNILLACGSGIATSTAVAGKIRELLDANGMAGEYKLTQCSIAEAITKANDADLLIATTAKPEGVTCPYVAGIAFLTGVGRQAAEQQVLDILKG